MYEGQLHVLSLAMKLSIYRDAVPMAEAVEFIF